MPGCTLVCFMRLVKLILLMAATAALSSCGGGSTASTACRLLVDVGAGQTVSAGRAVTLGANVSVECDGQAPAARTLTYQWSLSGAPPGSQATLELSTTATPRLRTDLPGTYLVALAVSDGVDFSLAGPVLVQAVPLQLATPSTPAAGPLALALDAASVIDLGNGGTRYRVRLRESNGASAPVLGSYLTLWFANGVKMGPMFFMTEPVTAKPDPGLSRVYEYDAPVDWVPLLWEYATPMDARSPNPALPQWRFPPT